MKATLGSLLIFALLIPMCAPAQKPAQKPAPAPVAQQGVTVIVVNAAVDPSQPVPSITVSLGYLGGAGSITEARDATTTRGEAFLLVSPDVMQRDDLRVEVNPAANPAAKDLVIYEPPDGQVHGLAATLPITLLPKGSVKLMEDAQIEATLRRLSQQASSQQKQVAQDKTEIQTLKSQVAAAQAQADKQKQGINTSLDDWAKANGLDPVVMEQKILQWANRIKSNPPTQESKGLAEFALGNYADAAKDLGAENDAAILSRNQRQQAERDADRAGLQQELGRAKTEATSYQLLARYHDATTTLEAIRDDIASQQKASPDDAVIKTIWLQSISATADARASEGEISSGADSVRLIALSLTDYQTLVTEYKEQGDRNMLALAELGLGNALVDQAERSTGVKATQLLDQGVVALKSALAVYTPANLPRNWASTQVGLGNALVDQGESADGDKSAPLFEQAVNAFNSALTVYTRATDPLNWALTENDLGVALSDQGERATGDKASDLYTKCIEAWQNALQVYTQAAYPEDWARTQSNLATVFDDQGQQAAGAKALALFAQAAEAARNSLKVYTQTDLPQSWARGQNNLGVALDDQAENSPADKAGPIYAQAADAFKSALEVYTKAAFPQDWAMAQNNLANVLIDLGEAATGSVAASCFSQAVVASRSALQIYTRADLPQDWAMAQDTLGDALFDQAQLTRGPGAASLLAQALVAYQNAGEIYTKQDFPADWAREQCGVANVRSAQGNFSAAASAFEASLAVNPDAADVLDETGGLYLDKLFDYAKALDTFGKLAKLDSSAAHTLRLAEAELTTSHFADCLQETGGIKDGDLAVLDNAARGAITLACQWGAAKQADALITDRSLSSGNATLQGSDSGLKGILHYLATSPAFANSRASWIALFTAIQNGNGSAMITALHQLEQLFQN